MEMNDSVSADALVGAGVVGDNAAATSLGTVPEEGMVNDENLENMWNHDQRIAAGFRSSNFKRTKKGGGVALLKGNHNGTTCFGVRPKIRKFMRSLNKVQRKKEARNHRRIKVKVYSRDMDQSYDEEATSKLGKAWARWFRRNGISGNESRLPILSPCHGANTTVRCWCTCPNRC